MPNSTIPKILNWRSSHHHWPPQPVALLQQPHSPSFHPPPCPPPFSPPLLPSHFLCVQRTLMPRVVGRGGLMYIFISRWLFSSGRESDRCQLSPRNQAIRCNRSHPFSIDRLQAWHVALTTLSKNIRFNFISVSEYIFRVRFNGSNTPRDIIYKKNLWPLRIHMTMKSYYDVPFASSPHELPRSEKLIPFLELSVNADVAFLSPRAFHNTLSWFPPFPCQLDEDSSGYSELMHARTRETERVLARQPGVSGRCTPMLACQREFDAPRHPLTSFYPTSQSRVILPRPPHVADTDATTETAGSNFRPSKTGSEPLFAHDDEIVSYVSYSLTPNLRGRSFYCVTCPLSCIRKKWKIFRDV